MAKSQTQAVRDHLMEHGRISVHDALFGGLEGMHPTRIAAIIFNLRKDGWAIETQEAPGKLAVYVLRSLPGNHALMWDGTDPNVGPRQQLSALVEDPGEEVVLREFTIVRYSCPQPGCDNGLYAVRAVVLAPGWVEGRCAKHGVQRLRAVR